MMITPEILLQNAKNYASEPALSVRDENGNWISENWADFYSYVMNISKSLLALGLGENDKVSIYSYNRKEWYAAYIGTQLVGGASVGVYHTCSSEEVEWIVGNSDSKVVFIGNNPMDNGEIEKMPNHRIHKILDNLEKVETVVLMDGIKMINHEKVISWDAFIARGKNIPEEDVKSKLDQIDENNTSCLIYTSGTTGNPKGVELTHKNWTFEIEINNAVFEFYQGERYVSWLPLAHVFGQLVDINYWVHNALHLFICDSPLFVVDYAKEVKPHLFIGVPRIYEKIYSNIKSAIDSKIILKIGLKIPFLSNVFKAKLKEATGFSKTRYAASGAAPINPDILRLFQSLDIPLYEGYGMTENTAVATINYHGNNKIGTVGRAINKTEVKISDDGEILIQGNHIMKGYYKNSVATQETLIDGWLHTGDIGKIDSDGYLSITGRKKEIYVSSGGKNIAPLVIEETMKSIPIVSQCFLVGDGRKYCSALFTLDASVILRDKIGIEANAIPKDPEQQLSMLKENAYSFSDFTESENVLAEIQSHVDKLNGQFSNPEQLKKFSILPRDFTIDDGELTPTLKIRRKQINENWAHVIESMYTD
ncbi:MAG: AMP-dependent synthetase/ligase [Candidatus Marinimicrobia bacterium]|jgi:long-chain acyl-CoA synthetase|nr:AMP-dependent synthetase/ligase [Candidatus Neomarinimicrobiota bacterium]MDP6611074.1 AMP-dependent synthetase/ligase [Candidatus Neomarinimicrobiota bacterium]|tara:strand:- start:45875 stop:47653 length:1779 start_codon:yes stop_codon:yes gene_type:complete